MARQVFQMIDKDNSGHARQGGDVRAQRPSFNPRASRLTRHRRDTVLTARSPRSVEAVSGREPGRFIPHQLRQRELQYLLVPARLDAAMAAIDTDSDGEITAIEWRVSEPEPFWGVPVAET